MERLQKRIVEILPTVDFEDKENLDVLENLPLQNKDDLQVMEAKLLDRIYRKQMLSRILLFHSISQKLVSLRKRIIYGMNK